MRSLPECKAGAPIGRPPSQTAPTSAVWRPALGHVSTDPKSSVRVRVVSSAPSPSAAATENASITIAPRRGQRPRRKLVRRTQSVWRICLLGLRVTATGRPVIAGADTANSTTLSRDTAAARGHQQLPPSVNSSWPTKHKLRHQKRRPFSHLGTRMKRSAGRAAASTPAALYKAA